MLAKDALDRSPRRGTLSWGSRSSRQRFELGKAGRNFGGEH
jgi:hypothetical protein